MMLTSDKPGARIIAELLSSYGVRHVVTCPGSRNAPLIVALDAMPDIITTVVVDERSAAFIAMGKALQSGRPVAVVCTSGSALLNIAPAASEAYYRHIPLIIISADRPKEWIDQDDSQTIRQPGAPAAGLKIFVTRRTSCAENISARMSSRSAYIRRASQSLWNW